MKAAKITENIYWVGAIDWNLRNFHGYSTQRGSTYNAYLIIDDKITLIDTVKSYLVDEMLDRIRSIVDPGKIDYVISNHVEMDHSGGLPKIMELAPYAKVITSPLGQKGLLAHYKREFNFQVMKTGDTLNLGQRNLHFVLTQMVHWPDNMVCYCPENKILFSNDAFGQHLASSERFDDEYPISVIFHEAKKYYANIVLPYSMQVKKALDTALKLNIDVIAPSHGIIWRDHHYNILSEYQKWSSNETTDRALIIYDTMWHSTEKMAHAIRCAFENRGMQVVMLNLQHNHISDIMTEVLTSQYICVGSPTLNNNMLPTVSAFLTYLCGLAPKGRTGMAFGSYGWGGQSVKQIEDILNDCGFEVLPSHKVQYVPSADDLNNIRQITEQSLV